MYTHSARASLINRRRRLSAFSFIHQTHERSAHLTLTGALVAHVEIAMAVSLTFSIGVARATAFFDRGRLSISFMGAAECETLGSGTKNTNETGLLRTGCDSLSIN